MRKIAFLFIIIFALSFSSVYSENKKDIKIVWTIWENFYSSSDDLDNMLIIFKSDFDLKDFSFSSSCDLETKHIANKKDFYLLNLSLKKRDCSNPYLVLKSDYFKKLLKLNIKNDFDILNKYTDYSNYKLNKIINSLEEDISKKSATTKSAYKNKINARLKKELSYKKAILEGILSKREDKYQVPVYGYTLPNENSKIPNAKRPYRYWFTDGIHHSWDIDTPFGFPVASLDDAIVIRVKKDWSWSEFKNLKYKNLSEKDKINNLDILRWNQVWLKTMKWDVVFYAHLDKVFSDVEVWSLVKKWTPLWTIWISWVPDKNYKDYHLDFSIQKNPYNASMAWKYSWDDYMRWDWYFKWRSRTYILNNQDKIFEEKL